MVKNDDYFVESSFNNNYLINKDLVLIIEEILTAESLPDAINVIITNSSDRAYMRIGFPVLEKEIHKAWHAFPRQGADNICYFLDRYSHAEIEFKISVYHDRMTAGLYRLIYLVNEASYEYDNSGIVSLVVYEFIVDSNATTHVDSRYSS